MSAAVARRAVPIVLVAVLIDTIGFGIVLPSLPTLLRQLDGATPAQAAGLGGWLQASFSLAQFAAGPVLGMLGDRFGRRPVLIASMVAFAVDYGLLSFAPTIGWLFLGRAVAGAAGSVTGPAGAVIADVTAPDRRAATFGYIGAAFGIGIVLGPALGGFAAAWGPRAPFVVAAGLAAINAAAMIVLMPETLAADARRPFRWRDATVIGAFQPLFGRRGAGPLLVSNFLWQVGAVVYPTVWAFWATLRFGWGGRAIGLSLAWIGLLMAAVQVGLTGRVIAALGERRAAMLGLAAGAACLGAYAFATAGWQVYALLPGRRAGGARVAGDERAVVAAGGRRRAGGVAGRHRRAQRRRVGRRAGDGGAGARARRRARVRRRRLPACERPAGGRYGDRRYVGPRWRRARGPALTASFRDDS